jgi:hypothetical protein
VYGLLLSVLRKWNILWSAAVEVEVELVVVAAALVVLELLQV